jgi:hypothetical protein
MKIEAEHNPSVYLEKCELIWETANKPAKEGNKYYFIFGLLLLIANLYYNKEFNWACLISILIMGYVANYFFQQNYKKKEYLNQAKVISEKYLQSNKPITWILSEDEFEYYDFQISLKIKWSLIKKHEVIGNILFLYQNDKVDNSITISKDEVGEENFNKIVEFVKTKIK